jgi:Amt family ammonium transporter
VGAFTMIVSAAVWMMIHKLVGIRVSEDDEIAGLDSAELGMESYPEFSR